VIASIPDPEDVPAELREREQWLMWDASADAPRRPHWRGDFGVSWTEPDDWHSFEEAREAALERDSWGIGYVFARSNDDHPRGLYGALDLDGCAEEGKGQPKEWLPSIEPFADRDAYIEWSPSGTGLHIPLAGFEPPEWWSDCHFTDDEHEGVEAYGSKFFTVTGDRLRGSGDTVADAGPWVEEWLAQAHKSITGEDPRNQGTEGGSPGSKGGDSTDETTPRSGDEWMDAERAREALEHVDPDKSYPTWRDIGFALADEFSERTALSIFEDWSRGGSKWDDEAEDLAERIITDAERGGGRSISTVVWHAQQGGWDASAAAREATASDGGTAAAAPAPDDDPGPEPSDDDTWALRPDSVKAFAALGEDGEISDLTDRQKAAHVWDLIRQSDDYHVRVRRDNASLWSYDDDRGVWEPEGERALRHAARQALGSTNYGANVLAELQAQARSDPTAEAEGEEFGLEPGYVAVANGLLDLEAAADGAGDDAKRDLRPDDLALTRLPVEYDPDADPAEWAALVEEWAEDGRADALQEYVGYCLEVGDMPIHRALLLVGSGANGKGTFLSVVRALLGVENTTSIELQTLANERDAVADFYGAVANIDDDLSARSLGAGLGMFKKLVAGDRVRARRLYEDGFQFRPTGKHLYAANEVPQVDVPDEDEAFWRRWLLVEFPNHYPPIERDPQLGDRLTEPDALSGVLNWAIEGRARLLEEGVFTGEDHFAQQKRERWQSWGESVDKFISECVERDPDADRLSTQDAHRRYAAWCRENGEDPVGQREFTNKLKNEDVEYKNSIRIDGKIERGYDALGLTDDVPDLEDTPERGADRGQLRDDDVTDY
jgi:putative DNA primase/helicase